MKKVLRHKDFLLAFVLAIVVSLTIFIYEPIMMYSNNTDDFWFDVYALIGVSLVIALISFIVLFGFFMAVKYVAAAIKKPTLFYVVLSICCAGFVIMYIHSNFLTSFLPPLDGSTFDWGDLSANIISVAVCLIVASVLIVGLVKIGSQKTFYYSMYVIFAVFTMLFISFASVALTSDMWRSKDIIAVATTKNLNNVSSDENYIILLLDAVDSVHFNSLMENGPYKNMLKDFSYFPDTLSGYAFTRDSIPFIFSGEWNENETFFPEYSTSAYNDSRFFAELSKKGFNRNFYEMELVWYDDKALA